MSLIKLMTEVQLLFPMITYDEYRDIISDLEEQCYRNRSEVLYERLVSNNPYNDVQTLHILNSLSSKIENKFYKDNDACQIVFELKGELEKKLNGSDEQPLITTHKPIENFTLFTPIKKEDPPNPPAPQRGFDSGKSDEYLKALYKALVEAQFIAPSTKESHFINAFNGKPLLDFVPLAWIDSTKGAVFLSYFLRAVQGYWKKTEHLIQPANYKALLSQSKTNGTFERLTSQLKKIETLLTDIDSQ